MTSQTQIINRRDRETVTIANGAAVSSAVDMEHHGARGLAVQVPSAWTAADIGFEVSVDGTTYYPLRDASGALAKITSVQTAAAAVYAGPSECWSVGAWNYLRLTSLNTSTGAAENQGAARTLVIAFLS